MLPIRLVFVLFLIPSIVSSQDLSVGQIEEKMLNSIAAITTLRYHFKSTERIGTDFKKAEQHVKYAKKPLRFYVYSINPDKGAEVLYNPTLSKDKVYVYPNAFPYYSLYLDPNGSILRKGKHHTLFELGFDNFYGIMHYIKKNSASYKKDLKLEGNVMWNNRKCYKVTLNLSDYKIYSYTVNEGETVSSIAKKYYLNDYKILELNNLSDYGALKAGQKILLPNYYAKNITIYIDAENFLPVMQEMHDEKGLYERYEFLDLKVNGPIADEEFTTGFKGYRF
ncbi:MAG: DUF1571 domain-containing protein [Cytophagaceae bacterium]